MIRVLPWIVGILPVIGITLAYWLNIRAGVQTSCMPLLDGCTSISATGRYMPGSLPFRAALLPQAAFLVVFWWIGMMWLEKLVPTTKNSKMIFVFGAIGAIALVLYVTFLGSHLPFYEFMKRFGIYFYFLGTALAQILLTWSMPRGYLRRAMLIVIATPFVLGIINLLQKLVLAQPNNIENRIEWISALLMQLWFVLLYFAFRKSALEITVRTDPPSVRR